MQEAREELCALDAAAGDGDLGTTLATGFGHVRAALDARPEGGPGALLSGTGSELARRAPSTMGTLLAFGFLRAGTALGGVEELLTEHVATMLEAATSAIGERGGAKVGERTVLDAMQPAAAAAAAAAAAGDDPYEALAAAATAAKGGAEATMRMEPRHGRALWIQDRARGGKDAGAAAWAIYLGGLADGCRSAAAPGRPKPSTKGEELP